MTRTGAPGRILTVKRMELRFVLKDLKPKMKIMLLFTQMKCHSKPVCSPRLRRRRSSSKAPPGCRTVFCLSRPAQIYWSLLESIKPHFFLVHTYSNLFFIAYWLLIGITRRLIDWLIGWLAAKWRTAESGQEEMALTVTWSGTLRVEEGWEMK